MCVQTHITYLPGPGSEAWAESIELLLSWAEDLWRLWCPPHGPDAVSPNTEKGFIPFLHGNQLLNPLVEY